MVSPNLPFKATPTAALVLGCCLVNSVYAADRPSVFDPEMGQFRLHARLSTALPDRVVRFGPRAASRLPVLGDWNGNGVDTLGLYDPVDGTFTLRNSNQGGNSDRKFRFGPRGGSGLPLSGDWNGDGIDTVGVYDFARGKFHLAELNRASAASNTFRFGPLGTKRFPVAGDWDGDGVDTVGLFDQGSSVFVLRNSNSAGAAKKKVAFAQWEGDNLPVAGDWTGNGRDSVGIYRPRVRQFRLKRSLAVGKSRIVFKVRGKNRDRSWPLAGQWQRAKRATEVDLRLNAGGKDFMDSQGLAWVGDGYLRQGVSIQARKKSVGGASPLYRTYRRPKPGSTKLRYKLAVPNGLYKVDLYFGDFPNARAGTFDVELEGRRLIPQLDVVAEVGTKNTLSKVRKVTVTDRQLVISLNRIAGEPQIAAIRVRGLDSVKNVGSEPKPDPKPEPKPKPKPEPKPKPKPEPKPKPKPEPKPKPKPEPKPKPKPEPYKMILRWAPNPEPVLGYRVYFGPNKNSTVLELRDLRVARGDVNPVTPRAGFKVKEDLGLSPGEKGCFRIVAYNVVGDSKFSEPVCGRI